jgi:FkbM family methyltransferase
MSSKALKGIVQALHVHYRDTRHAAGMDALYRRFLAPHDLAFDIGSLVGNRIGSFRRLAARVVAVEPGPLAHRALRLLYGHDPHVTLVAAACGAAPGTARLSLNSENPSVSTVSRAFIDAAHGADGWHGQCWDQTIDAACTTLDALIAEYGVPQFIKIDVEGHEADVLVGLSMPVAAISFEFTTIQREVARGCLDRLADLGPYVFNVSLREDNRLMFEQPVDAAQMARYVRDLPDEANSGDIYATLQQP